MRYRELDAAIRQLVAAAGEDGLRAFGAATVAVLVRDEALLELATEDELDRGAWAALAAARDAVPTATAGELRPLLARIDAGIRPEGDLDPGLLIVISALEHWTNFLEHGRRGELYELAIRAIERVDFEVSADLDDFLAEPGMAAEFERIRRLLTA